MAVLAIVVEAIISWFKIPIPWLQGKPSPEVVLKEVKGWLGDDADNQEAHINAINKALKAVGETELGKDATVADIAQKVGDAFTKYTEVERKRRALIRLIAVVLGIGAAWVFKIDTMILLSPIYMKTPLTEISAIGIMLSGLSASAGSSFWHDQSARLRQIKAAKESVEQIV